MPLRAPLKIVDTPVLSGPSSAAEKSAFSEACVWKPVGKGWQPLHGSFQTLGYSVEWHDFHTKRELDVSGSYHPDSVEICLNVAGHGTVSGGEQRLDLAPATVGFYRQTEPKLRGVRARDERHHFVTVELSREFITQHLLPDAPGVDPWLRDFTARRPVVSVAGPSRLTSEQENLVRTLQNPPANEAARCVWARAKALEIAATIFYPPPAGELFCERLQRINRERVQRVIALLKENLADTPTLEEIGRRVGCSRFHLSRIFSEQMGCSIFQHLRTLRLERAAELICRGDLKMTDVALEVGYASPSHFTTAFREAFGCCPGLFPLRRRTVPVEPAGRSD